MKRKIIIGQCIDCPYIDTGWALALEITKDGLTQYIIVLVTRMPMPQKRLIKIQYLNGARWIGREIYD